MAVQAIPLRDGKFIVADHANGIYKEVQAVILVTGKPSASSIWDQAFREKGEEAVIDVQQKGLEHANFHPTLLKDPAIIEAFRTEIKKEVGATE